MLDRASFLGKRSNVVGWIALLAGFALLVSALALGRFMPAQAGSSKINALPAGNSAAVRAQAPAGPNGSNAILNMFQWTWDSIAAECTNVIGPAGFGYVQVSPPQEHIVGELGGSGSPWWTSYQPVSYKLESKLGTEAEFKAMVDTCADAGVGIIADAVINHMTGQTDPGVGWAGTEYSLENYPGPEGQYSAEHFHECKHDIANYGDRAEVQNCRLVGLQDLDTSNPYVQQEIADYLDKLANLGVAGYRIDAAKHMAATDLEAIKARTTQAKNKYWVHEVIGSGGEPIQPAEYFRTGDSHEFNYARTLKSAFKGRISSLQKLAINQDLASGYNAGVFVDNHDTERNQETLSYHAGDTYLLANVFLFSYPYGSPSAYTGYTFANDGVAREFGAPQTSTGEVLDVNCSEGVFTCIHREPEVANMVGFYNDVRATAMNNWQNADNGNVVGYGRGEKGFVVLNNSNSTSTHTYRTFLPQGTYCNVVASTRLENCDETFTVESDGTVTVTVPSGKAVVLWAKHATLTGSPVYTTNQTNVYFHKYSSWAAAYLHHGATPGWTTAPGVKMSEVCEGWYTVAVDADGPFEGVPNDGADAWNNAMGGGNYTLAGESVAISHGVALDIDPCAATTQTQIVVYYKPAEGQTAVNIHYGYGTRGWTQVPGIAMSPTCNGWFKKTVTTDGSELEFVFNDGQGNWDNIRPGENYTAYGPIVAVNNKEVLEEAPCSPDEDLPEEAPEPVEPETLNFDEVRVFYKENTAWAKHFVHYGREDAWTAVPGVEMHLVCDTWYGYTIDQVRGLTHVSLTFNDGGETWDSNGGANYKALHPVVAIDEGTVSDTHPCPTNGQDPDGGTGGGGTDGGSDGSGDGDDPQAPGTSDPTSEPTRDAEDAPDSNGTRAAEEHNTVGTGTQQTGNSEDTTAPNTGQGEEAEARANLADTGQSTFVLYLGILALLSGAGLVAATSSRTKKHNTSH